MKYIPKDRSTWISSSSGFQSDEYYSDDADINIARITLTNRYPEEGRTMNTRSKMCCYILEGSGTLFVDETSQKIEVGDVCIIEPEEKYYWETTALTLLIASTPPWDVDQTNATK